MPGTLLLAVCPMGPDRGKIGELARLRISVTGWAPGGTASQEAGGQPGLATIEPAQQIIPAQGQAWRAVRILIFDHDPTRVFRDLQRVQAPSGEFLWICPDHYTEYDPSLPSIPGG